MLVEAAITRLTKFGAFARLEKDLEGFIHISEISEKHIEHPKEVLNEGDAVTLRIIKIEPRISPHRFELASCAFSGLCRPRLAVARAGYG